MSRIDKQVSKQGKRGRRRHQISVRKAPGVELSAASAGWKGESQNLEIGQIASEAASPRPGSGRKQVIEEPDGRGLFAGRTSDYTNTPLARDKYITP